MLRTQSVIIELLAAARLLRLEQLLLIFVVILELQRLLQFGY